MANPSKRKGTAWEVRLRDWWRTQGAPHCERLALSGNQDRGDLTGFGAPIVVEAKNHKQMDPAAFIDELERQMKNAGTEIGAVMMPRRGKPVGKGYTLMTNEMLALLWRQAGWIGEAE